MKGINKNLLLMIIFSVAFGFVAGILGFVSAGSGGFSLPFFGQIKFSDMDLDRQIVIDQPRNVVVEQDLQLKQIENDLLPTLIGIYKQKTSQQVLNQVYLDTDKLGQGFVLTADGWIVSHQDVISNNTDQYVAFGYQNKQYPISNYVVDEVTGLVFSQIEANNLPVAKLGRSDDLFVGQTVVVASDRDRLDIAHISKIGYEFNSAQEIIQSTQALNKQLWLDIDINQAHTGAVVTNLKGEIVGVVSRDKIILVDYFRDIIGQVLDSQQITRASLNLNYIDLAQVEGLLTYGDKGALVYGQIPATSPVYNQLKANDVIKKIDDVEINSYQSLSELINTYRVGNTVELLVQRGDQELTFELKLN